MQKKKTKKTKKYSRAEIKEIYEKFWSLYDPDVHKMSWLVESRIQSKHYSYRTMQKFVDCLEFFESTYGRESYRLEFAFYITGRSENKDMFLRIFDLNGKEVSFFKVKKNGDKYGAFECPDE